MMGRIYVIGDVHGCARELETLLAALPLGQGDVVAFIGDYIDRGPESRAVVDMLLVLRARSDIETVFLKGNHEDMCLAYLGRGGLWGEAWRMNGGVTTLRSYGVSPQLGGAEAAAQFPPAHLDFFSSLALQHLSGDYLLVHAGIRPTRALEAQDPEDLLWIREEFISSRHDLPYTVVFGHTPQRRVLVDLPYKVGIDTGCVYGGRLTAFELCERVLFQVAYNERQVKQTPLPPGSFRHAAASRS
jgi:diadenosine tetraphosphatase ApaH/serine/threonine PP2A family protein phosphatase